VTAEDNGEVIGIDAKHITVLYNNGEKKMYEMITFGRSNSDMILHQKPLVSHGQKVKK
jgi:DNA-directed RNA polymerase subunit beta